jgi:ferritin-like metal-binding protein YciE
MGIASLTDLYLNEIADLLQTEREAIPVLQRLASSAHAPELREILARHADTSRLHVERLQLILARLGAPDPQGRSGPGEALLAMAGNRVARASAPDVRDAAIIGATQRLKHYAIASYGGARAYARRLARREDADLLETSLVDEGLADHRLSEIAQAHANGDARTAADVHRSRGSLRFRGRTGTHLGRVDGLVVDADAGRPAYVVLDARGLLGGHRRLVPVTELRFDASDRSLCLDADALGQYPSFDPAGLPTLSPDAPGAPRGSSSFSSGSRSSTLTVGSRGDE